MLLPLLWLACAAPADTAAPCGLTSTVPGFDPRCQAVLAHFAEESRLVVDERLTAYLPPDPTVDTTYGGLSGNPLIVTLDDTLAQDRESTVTLGPDGSTVRLQLVFETGQVSGLLEARVVQGD